MQLSKKDVNRLLKSGVAEFIATMNPVTKILTRQGIDELLLGMR